MTEPCDLEACEARELIGRRQLSPVELVTSCLERIDAVNAAVNAVVTLDHETAISTATRQERELMDGEPLGLLHGLPVGVKDLEPVAGMRSTFGSLLYEHHVPEHDNAMVANLRSAGANLFCKTNTPEFGAGANTKNRVFGATGNPFAPHKTCGGSSGGSAVALATGMAPLATGSDYGGSLRTPAGFCGVVGFRPSPGVVPRSDAVVSLSPFGVLGPMGRTVRDAHLLLRAQLDINNLDPFSSSDVELIPDTLHPLDLSSLRVATTVDFGCAPVDNNIREVFDQRISLFSHLFSDCSRRDPDMQDVDLAFEVLRCIGFVASYDDLLKTQRDQLGPNVIDNTERGANYTLHDVARANLQQTLIYQHFNQFFDDADILIAPVASVSPFPHEQLSVTEINGEQMPTYMRWLALSYAVTTALGCSVALPCGLDHLGMPFGIQVIGPRGSDAKVFAAALALEQALKDSDSTRRPVPDLEVLSA